MGVNWGGRSVDKSWSINGTSGVSVGTSLRDEMIKILYGDGSQKAQGHIVLIRHMDQVCPCMQEEQGQLHRKADPNCSICHGEGYSYVDRPHTAWRSVVGSNSGSQVGSLTEGDPGVATINGFNFFFDYTTQVEERDKIIELALSAEGIPPSVLGEANYKEKFKIVQRIIYRADNGRIEFVRCICEREEW